MKTRLRELAPAARGSKDAGSRNLVFAEYYTFALRSTRDAFYERSKEEGTPVTGPLHKMASEPAAQENSHKDFTQIFIGQTEVPGDPRLFSTYHRRRGSRRRLL